MGHVNPERIVEPEEKLGGEALEEQEFPRSLAAAIDVVLDFAGRDRVGSAAEDPLKATELWDYVSSRLGVNDSNRPLLMDCVDRNSFKDKPARVEMAAWVTVMSAARREYGDEKVERHRYRDKGR